MATGLAVLFAGLMPQCHAGWLNPARQGFIIQTYTSQDPISGNNSGTIQTNGNSFQIAGDNTGVIFTGGPGVQFRGKNDGSVYVDGIGAFTLGFFGTLSTATNRGKGALMLCDLSPGQKAMITDVGNAVILIGAGTVSNGQCIVVGDGNVSHGLRSVTADSFWGMGSGFFGNGSGLTDLAVGGVPLTNMTAYRISVADTNAWANGVAVAGSALQRSGGTVSGSVAVVAGLVELRADAVTETTSVLRIWNAANDAYADIEWDTDSDGGLQVAGGLYIKLPSVREFQADWEVNGAAFDGWKFSKVGSRLVFSTVDPDEAVVAISSTGLVLEAGAYYGDGSGLTNLNFGASLPVGAAGAFSVVSGTQLVFVAGAVTNVLDWDITQP